MIRGEIWARLHQLKEGGLAMLIVDKEIDALCAFVDRHYVIEKGEIVWSGPTARMLADPAIRETYIGL